jgi:hypothetical protein
VLAGKLSWQLTGLYKMADLTILIKRKMTKISHFCHRTVDVTYAIRPKRQTKPHLPGGVAPALIPLIVTLHGRSPRLLKLRQRHERHEPLVLSPTSRHPSLVFAQYRPDRERRVELCWIQKMMRSLRCPPLLRAGVRAAREIQGEQEQEQERGPVGELVRDVVR